MTTYPLSGIRVLDFSRVLAGPFCTMILGDLGAEVIKVENPDGGDETRTWGPPYAQTTPPLSAYFCAVNRNKKSITLDLKNPQDQAIARRLAKQSHIVVENFKVGQMRSFGLDDDRLRKDNPALVYCSITGFGQTGLYRDHAGYDYVIQAMSGLMSITGETERSPVKVGVAVTDVFTGLFACTAILAALRHAEHTGQGQTIDMALFDSQLAALVNVASNVLISGKDAPRYGNQHPNIVPYQSFNAKDKAFVLTIGNDKQFRKLCDILHTPELAEHPDYATNPARVANREQLTHILGEIFRTQSADFWVTRCIEAGIPAGEINTVQDAVQHPHTESRQLIDVIHDVTGAAIPMITSPLRLSTTPPEIRYPPPQLGQHNDFIDQWLDEPL
jgi:crotonobetainyl-CoA:carnitine CoA-transferase CaiB-like acyl-CoA transferase